VFPPGVLVNVQFPGVGKPVNCTLPVGTVQVGLVIVPTVGGAGANATGLMTTFPDEPDIHPEAFVTLYV